MAQAARVWLPIVIVRGHVCGAPGDEQRHSAALTDSANAQRPSATQAATHAG